MADASAGKTAGNGCVISSIIVSGLTQNQPVLAVGSDPFRRCDANRLTAPEEAIRRAIRSVEGLPASPELTNAVIQLDSVLNKVADFTDAQREVAEIIGIICQRADTDKPVCVSMSMEQVKFLARILRGESTLV